MLLVMGLNFVHLKTFNLKNKRDNINKNVNYLTSKMEEIKKRKISDERRWKKEE